MNKERLPEELFHLEFPDAPDFISEPPQYTMLEMIEMCEKMLPYWNLEREKNPPKPFVGEAFEI